MLGLHIDRTYQGHLEVWIRGLLARSSRSPIIA
jgi:hypothetical protein